VAKLVLISGWLLDVLAAIWMALILLKLLTAWLVPAQAEKGLLFQAGRLVDLPVNFLRRVMPTVYRAVDFAPWLTLVMLVLVKTFVFRAMIYWGMLHK
jgi:uncharacterized protein YggT (Ycf19 family)